MVSLVSGEVLGDHPPRLIEAARYAVFDDLNDGMVLAPSVDEVIDLGESLDGHAFDQLVVLVEIQGQHVQVGLEGDAKGLMALMVRDDSTIHRLVDADVAPDEDGSLQSGGVSVPVPRRQLVSSEDALREFRTFLSSGKFDEAASWDREPSIVPSPEDRDT